MIIKEWEKVSLRTLAAATRSTQFGPFHSLGFYIVLFDLFFMDVLTHTLPPNPISNLCFIYAEPTTTILGTPELFIDTTSTINLTCIVQGLNEPPTSIQWTHNGYEINYDRLSLSF